MKFNRFGGDPRAVAKEEAVEGFDVLPAAPDPVDEAAEDDGLDDLSVEELSSILNERGMALAMGTPRDQIIAALRSG